MSAAYDASDRRGGPGLGIAGPRTGDEWLRTRPIEEQLAEYARREAEDAAEALPETKAAIASCDGGEYCSCASARIMVARMTTRTAAADSDSLHVLVRHDKTVTVTLEAGGR
jgi:hypothetical protein